MFAVIRVLIDRFKALFMARALIELEADLITLAAERKAELLRRADELDKEGWSAVAHQMREQAATLQFDAPLASGHAVVAHLQTQSLESAQPKEAMPNPQAESGPAERVPPATRKKRLE
jgi:hypothetical protein